MSTDVASRIAYLRQRIAEIEARLPMHSVSASMAIELDDLEDELRRLLEGQVASADRKEP